MDLLSKEFLSKYKDEPDDMNQLAKFVFYRTYSRWLADFGRRESFKESIARAVNYSVGLGIEHTKKNKFPVEYKYFVEEAEILFDNIYNRRQFLSGRTHWVGGSDTKVAQKYPLSNFNCSFLEINSWEDITELFYLLLIGTGVGIGCSQEQARLLPTIRRNYKLSHSEYKPVATSERLQETKLVLMDNGYAKIYIGDNKEGWIKALGIFFNLITEPSLSDYHTIKISYNSIRPRGERLKTFGGTASGHETLKDMFEGIDKVFKDELDNRIEPMETTDRPGMPQKAITQYHARPIHILDICNLIGNNVVAGGVRRTAEIFLCDDDDYEVIFAKYGIYGVYDMEAHQKIGEKLYALDIKPTWWDDVKKDVAIPNLSHRAMSNNSVLFSTKPSTELLSVYMDLIKLNGEPGFINLEEIQRRRPNGRGVNPLIA